MKILMIYPHSVYGGGSSYYFRSLANNMCDTDIVALLCPKPYPDASISRYELKIPFRVSNSSNIIWSDARSYASLSDIELTQYEEAVSTSIKKAVLDFRPDVIQVHFLLPALTQALEVASVMGIPVIATSHGADIRLNEESKRYHQKIGYNLRQVSSVVGVSPSHCQWITDVFPDAHDRVVCIPGGIDIEAFQAPCDLSVNYPYNPHNNKYVLGVGRFERRKGFHFLIEAAKTLPCDVVIVGDGWERPELEKIIRNGKVSNVHLIPFIDLKNRHQLIELYRHSIALVIPSTTKDETLCFVGIEGMAAGTVVIGSDVGGIPYILDKGKCGLLVQPAKPAAITAAIIKIMSDPSLRQRLISRGRYRAQTRFNWKQVATEYRQLFRQVESAGSNKIP